MTKHYSAVASSHDTQSANYLQAVGSTLTATAYGQAVAPPPGSDSRLDPVQALIDLLGNLPGDYDTWRRIIEEPYG